MPTWFNDKQEELYEFITGDNTERYTSARKAVTYNSNTYTPKNITRDEIKSSTDVFRNTLKLTLPITDSMAQTYIGTTLDVNVRVRILGNLSGSYEYIWQGRIISASTDGSEVTLNCEEITTSTKRMGLTPTFQHGCRHALYSKSCQLNKADWATVGTVAGIDGKSLTLSGEAAALEDGYLVAGFIEINGVNRYITAHAGGVITLSRNFTDDPTGKDCTVYAGCAHSYSACQSKFNNLDNFGGFPYLTDNPFTIGNIFNKG